MRIFEVDVDANEYQWICPAEEMPDELLLSTTVFDGSKREKVWKPFEFYVFNPKNTKGNFYTIGNGTAFACDQTAIYLLGSFLGFGSELLPIFLEDGTELFILNVTDVVNALDQKKTIFDYYDNGKRGRVLKPAFHKNRFSESSIFKIPEKSSILTYSGVKSPEDEFRTAYLKSGLKGLIFVEVYSDDDAVHIP